jgi:hypothetical protein
MPKPSGKKKSASKKKSVAPAALSDLPTFRAGMPALDSIIAVRPLTPPSAPGAPEAPAAPTSAYRIITTNEVDAYEAGATPHEILAAPAAPAPAGDDFGGTARKAAKLSIANAPTEKFKDLKTLIKSLTADSAMVAHVPKIKTTATSNRVKEEKRNVSVKVFLYAASREADNDFHLILGRDPKATPEMYMTMELSGLPPANSASFSKLNAARDAFKAFFGTNLPGTTYDFYDPPIPVDIEGSLFFDMTHATGQHPGPKSLKSRIPTIWEVHPITKIAFKP